MLVSIVAILIYLWYRVTLNPYACGSIQHYTPPVIEAAYPHIGPAEWESEYGPSDLPTSIVDAIQTYLPYDEFVVISFVDKSYIDVAMNFYERSIAWHNIANFMFVSQSRDTCLEFFRQNILCVLYEEQTDDTSRDTPFGSKQFIDKMNIRLHLLSYLLNNNVTFLLSDADVVFFQDPTEDLLEVCTYDAQRSDSDLRESQLDLAADADICGLQDKAHLNAGFMLMRPTAATKRVVSRALDLARDNYKLNDQQTINMAINESDSIHVHRLNVTRYMNGNLYFEKAKRHFSDAAVPCDECVVVHNNYIISKAAKIYRFKENHLWMFDGDSYYSNPSGRYLTYENPRVTSLNKQIELEKNALKNALAIGRILNRTVILPKFRCSDAPRTECPLNAHYNIKDFDTIFGGRYREHTFLSHPKVSEEIVSHESSVYLIITEDVLELHMNAPESVTQVLSEADDVTDVEISEWFSALDGVPVLRFHSLYFAFSSFSDNLQNDHSLCRFWYGLQADNYMQTKYFNS